MRVLLAAVILFIAGAVFGTASPNVLWTWFDDEGLQEELLGAYPSPGGYLLSGRVRTETGYRSWSGLLSRDGIPVTERIYATSALDLPLQPLDDGTFLGYGRVAGDTLHAFLLHVGPDGDSLGVTLAPFRTGWIPSRMAIADTSCVVVGRFWDAQLHAYSGYAQRVSRNGNQSWWTPLPGGDSRDVVAVVPTPGGEWVVAGTVVDSTGNADMILTCLDNDGVVRWERTFIEDRSETVNSMIGTPDGGFLLLGYTTSFSGGAPDFYAVKTDAEGIESWRQHYGTPGQEVGRDCAVVEGTGYLLAGNKAIVDEGSHPLVHLIDFAGNLIWTKLIDQGNSTLCYQVRTDPVCGWVLRGEGFSGQSVNPVIIRLDDLLPDFSVDNAIGPAPLTCRFTDLSLPARHTVSWDLDGDGISDSTDPSPSFTYITEGYHTVSITVANAAGERTETRLDFIYVEDVEADDTACPKRFDLKVEREFTGIAFSIDRPASVSIGLFDLRGRLLRSWTPGRMVPGEHRLAWDGRDSRGRTLADGVYLFRLKADGRVTTRRAVLTR